MDTLLFLLGRAFLGIVQMLPLKCVALLGRLGGGLAYWLDGRHRKVALRNLAMCFGAEMSTEQIRRLAHENFRRIGESFACGLRTATMSIEQLRPHLYVGTPVYRWSVDAAAPARAVAAIGHFGNFELYARCDELAPGYRCATTYRALSVPALDRLFQSLRERSGCRYFERRFEATALKNFMNESGVFLGLLSDQHAGNSGVRLPFLGHECSTSTAPALFALRYHCVLITGFCFRTGLAKWRLEAGPEIPTRIDGKPRPIADIMADVNRSFEAAVRRDPANWFWVHNRWKDRRKTKESAASPAAIAPGNTPAVG